MGEKEIIKIHKKRGAFQENTFTITSHKFGFMANVLTYLPSQIQKKELRYAAISH